MSQKIEIEHRGHKISYSENMDEWVCYDLSGKKQSSHKLSIVKSNIDKMYQAARKTKAVACFELTGHARDKRIDASIIEYLGAQHDRIIPMSRLLGPAVHKVAVVSKHPDSGSRRRHEVTLDKLIAATEEAEAKWAEYLAAVDEAKAASRKVDEALRAVPRVTIEDVAALVDLYEQGVGK